MCASFSSYTLHFRMVSHKHLHRGDHNLVFSCIYSSIQHFSGLCDKAFDGYVFEDNLALSKPSLRICIYCKFQNIFHCSNDRKATFFHISGYNQLQKHPPSKDISVDGIHMPSSFELFLYTQTYCSRHCIFHGKDAHKKEPVYMASCRKPLLLS